MSLFSLPSGALLLGLLVQLTAAAQSPASPAFTAEPTGPIPIEPDSAMRRHYMQYRVRSVTKVRLDKEGTVRDTIEYQEIDELGRRTAWVRFGPQGRERQQWTYNPAGHCTSLIRHRSPTRPFTILYTYNPKVGRGVREVLQDNGKRTVVCELQRRQCGDTLLTHGRFRPLAIGRYQFRASGLFRSVQYALHPDTILVINDTYLSNGRHERTQVDYEILRHGIPVETGRLNLPTALAGQLSRNNLFKGSISTAGLHQVAWLMRQGGRYLTRTAYYRYDSQRCLLAAEVTVAPSDLRLVPYSSSLKNTYNSLHQLIGQQRSTYTTRLTEDSYNVFSYAANGLLTGETTNSRSAKPVFYRYLYQHYE